MIFFWDALLFHELDDLMIIGGHLGHAQQTGMALNMAPFDGVFPDGFRTFRPHPLGLLGLADQPVPGLEAHPLDSPWPGRGLWVSPRPRPTTHDPLSDPRKPAKRVGSR